MYIDVLQGIVFLLVGLIGMFVWQKYTKREYLWFALIAFAGLVLKVWDYLSIHVFNLSTVPDAVNSGISVIIWVMLIAVVLKIVLSNSKT
jgi:hypothetical protein